ncbi:MAG TPA: hypothetical protein VFV33_16595, partial [Gemmatimonadaceae bacterium]|nr:hypothetical protein [Gemmatimonadaceae bacterium]
MGDTTFTAPASAIVGQPFDLSLTNAQVPGFPNVTTFSYVFDCGIGIYIPSGTTNNASCSYGTAPTILVRGLVIDPDADSTEFLAAVVVKTPQDATTALKTDVAATSLSPDIRRSLVVKLDAAIAAIAANNKGT